MSLETSPRAVRFQPDDETILRAESARSPRPLSLAIAPDYHGVASPDHPVEYDGLPRYPDGISLGSMSALAGQALVNGGMAGAGWRGGGGGDGDPNLYANGVVATPAVAWQPPQRPMGPVRTPSNTYAPQRRPQTTLIESVRSQSRNRPSRQSDRFRAQEKAYVQRLRHDTDYFDPHHSTGIAGGHPDSDSEGETPSSDGPFDDRFDQEETIMFYGNDDLHPTEEDLRDVVNRERLEWHGMLEAVLLGDVVRQEKKRLIGSSEGGAAKTPQRAEELWLGIRARVCGRLLAVQRRMVEESRTGLDRLLDEITNFEIKGSSEVGKGPYDQVKDVVRKIEKCEAMYCSWSALATEHKAAHSTLFTEAYESIISWYNTNELIGTELAILKKWVGNDELNFTHTKQRSPASNGISDEVSFLDRLMKEEDGLKWLYDEVYEDERRRTQTDSDDPGIIAIAGGGVGGVGGRQGGHAKNPKEKGMLVPIMTVITKAKETLIHNHAAFQKRHLPPYIEELLTLISFPTRLIEEIIKVRLANAKKVRDSVQQNSLVQNQWIKQFQLMLRLAIRIKNEYTAIALPQPGWDLPPCVDDDHDLVILEALKYYFKMLNWKLSGNKNTFREAELLFQEWDFANDIGRQLQGGDFVVAEQFSALTFKALSRLSLTFERELQVKPKESLGEMSKRYKQMLDSVRVRQRMLQRFSRMLSNNYEHACDFSISFPPERLQDLYDRLAASHHFQVYTDVFEHDGTIVLASPDLQRRPDDVQALMALTSPDVFADEAGLPYLLIIRPEVIPEWYGAVIAMPLREQSLDLKRGHVRLCACGSQTQLAGSRKAFLDAIDMHLDLVVEQRSNLHKVNARLMEIRKVAFKLSNTFMESVETIRRQTEGRDCQELIQTCFVFATDFGQRSLLIMDSNRRQMNNIKLTKLALDWVGFICDDCVATDRITFRWAVLALEFAMIMTRGRHILALGGDEYRRLRYKVSGCMGLLISHFDIMGARSAQADQAERERMEGMLLQFRRLDKNRLADDDEAMRHTAERRCGRLLAVDELRREKDAARQAVGQVLEANNEVDRSLAYLSSAATNVTMRWQLGSFVGGGTFGNVYSAVNLESGQIMAVKEIRLQDPKLIPMIAGQIKDEMGVLELLDHPNIVSYYGIEVHRDRVYIFMEFCSGGSLSSLLEHGRIEDEQVIMVYALQMLEGLAYLHESGIAHRDIKPENILLDHNGIIKYVDFGAAKVIARQGRTLVADLTSTKPNKSMTGTPMYMSPEVIRGEKAGRLGAVDVWSLGCVILEMATGRRPWAHLDNEWAVMYSIAQGNPPQLPAPDQLSTTGIDFLRRCFMRDPTQRASAVELLQHEWMMTIRSQVVEPATPSDLSTGSAQGTPTVGAGPGARNGLDGVGFY